ncbi:MAG: hypothetical protein NW200_10660 [Hyphomonadaceae bacterium]|nr:hypothetical protein [Hyphomonadaceae bacterium]
MTAAPPPKLDTQEGRDAYRRELRRVAQPLRLSGLGIVITGALLAIASRFAAAAFPPWIDTVIFALLGIGWAILIYVIYLRSRYHRRRMAGVEGK